MIEVLSLGGSLFCPNEVDVLFLKKFKDFILKWIKNGKRFVIFVGGGKIARDYQEVGRKFKIKSEDLDWIGISATLLNAQLLRTIFGKFAFEKVLNNPTEKISTKKKIIIFGGWKPGWSTDFDAVVAAKTFGTKRVINLSNIDFVYDKDPRKFKGVKPLEKISFNELLKIVGNVWKPGANLPFDPKALKLAKEEKIKIIILNGKDFKNLEKVFLGGKFRGTIVE
jgi:uridylate kinase